MIIRPKNIDCKFPFPWNFHWWHGYFCSLSLYVRYGLLDVIYEPIRTNHGLLSIPQWPSYPDD